MPMEPEPQSPSEQELALTLDQVEEATNREALRESLIFETLMEKLAFPRNPDSLPPMDVPSMKQLPLQKLMRLLGK
jgi:hypothetical protein